ncbi:MAG TPA: carboxymuconolactone decarboxylase family protein [Puia sp.]|nr:carboxymuconolactone decarboxylase family protein [Puia sp.]
MEQRFKMRDVQPAAYKPLNELAGYVAGSSLTPIQQELIKIRASQINGCAYCVNKHSKDARKLGETEQRIFLLPVWRESPQFNEEERLMLEMTEEITLLHQHGLSEPVYQHAIKLFGEERTAHVIMAIININAWNRIGVSLRMQPE